MFRGLEYEYCLEEGYEIVFDKPDGIRKEDLDWTSLQMLEHTKIPSLLPFEAEVRDFTYRFRYSIGRKRSINQYIKGQKLKQQEYLILLHRLVLAVEKRYEFMLLESGFVLDEEFIFLGHDVGDVYLLYLPLKEMDEHVPVLKQVKALALRWMKSIEDFEGGVVQELFYIMEQDDCVTEQIVKFLTDAITTQPSKRSVVNGVMGEEILRGEPPFCHHPQNEGSPAQQADVVHRTGTESAEFMAFGQSTSTVEQSSEQPDVPNDARTETERQQSQEEIKEQKKASRIPLTSRQRTYLYLSVLILIALTWRLYLAYPFPLFQYVGIGITFLSLLLALFFPRLRSITPKIFSHQKKTKVSMATEKRKSTPKREAESRFGYGHPPEQRTGPSVSSAEMDNHPSPVAIQGTTLFARNHQTQLLSSTSKRTEKRLLIRFADGGEEHPVPTLPYVLGRDPQTAGFKLDKPGISRAHAELLEKENTLFVKDLCSKNGTFLNGQRLIPNREYVLEPNDHLKLADTELMIQFDHKNLHSHV